MKSSCPARDVGRSTAFQALATTLVVLALPLEASALQGGELFEEVVETLSTRYYDESFRQNELPELARSFRPRARTAAPWTTSGARCTTSWARFPPVTSRCTQKLRSMRCGRSWSLASRRPSGSSFVKSTASTLPTGCWRVVPADRAGLQRGDRVLAIDETRPAESARLDWRSDDAALPILPCTRCSARRGSARTS